MAQRIKIKSGSSGAASLPLLTGEPAYSINDNRLYIGNGSSVVRVDAGSYTAECSTAATTAAKTVNCTGFILFKGVEITIKFTVDNTAAVSELTLNVGGTGAKPIRYRNAYLLSPSTLSKNRVYKFYYGGNNWELIGDLDIDTTVATELASHTDNSEIHITSTERTNWNAAYGWGNHASAGYAAASALSSHTGKTSNPHSVTKSQVGLGSVENTALSTWTGSTAITTLGTIATGTWNATTIAVGKGGTGKTSIASGKMLYASAANTYSELTTSAFGRGLLNAVSGTMVTGLNADQIDGYHAAGLWRTDNAGSSSYDWAAKNLNVAGYVQVGSARIVYVPADAGTGTPGYIKIQHADGSTAMHLITTGGQTMYSTGVPAEGGSGGATVILNGVTTDNAVFWAPTAPGTQGQYLVFNNGLPAWVDFPTTWAWGSLTDVPSTFTPSAHSHLWAHITDKPSTFAPSAHTHTKSQITDFAHTHDDRYYTEIEINTLLTNKSNWDTAYGWGNHASAGYALNSAFNTHNNDNVRHITGAERTKWNGVVTDFGNLEIGGRNLLRGSGVEVSNGSYNIARYDLTDEIKAGEEVTLTIWGSLAATKSYFRAYNSGGFVSVATLTDNGDGTYSRTFTWAIGSSTNTYLNVYAFTNTQTGISTINKIKLEKGNKATDWTPAPEDVQASIDLKANLASPTFTGVVTAPTFIGALSGNATTATKLGTVTVGSTQLPFYLNAGTATAITQANLRKGLFGTTAIGSSTRPIYIAENGVPTAITGSIANSTTGSAATLTNTRTIWGQNFNGSANVTGALSGATTGSFSSTISANRIVVTSTSNEKHLEFSRSDYNYIASKGHIGLITGGTTTSSANQQVWIHSNGNTKIGAGSSSVPAYTLDVNGTGRYTSNLSVGGTLGVTGNTTLSGTLGVTGATTLTTATVTNQLNFGSSGKWINQNGSANLYDVTAYNLLIKHEKPFINFYFDKGSEVTSRIIEQAAGVLDVIGSVKIPDSKYLQIGSARLTYETVGGVGFLKLAHSNGSTAMHLVTTGGQTMYSTGVPATGGGGGATILLNNVTYGEGSTATIFSPTSIGYPGYILKADYPSGLPVWDNISNLLPDASTSVKGVAKLAGSGSATTVARSDHNHTGVYAAASHGHATLLYTELLYTDSYSDTHNVLGYSGTSEYDITLGNDTYKTIIDGSPIVLEPFISYTGLVKCTNGTLSVDTNTYLTGITKTMVDAVSCNADTVDNLHASSFLRSDAAISSDIVFAPINGVGITFWDNPKYKITVTHISDTVYGGRITGENSSDWNMYFQEYSGEEMIYNRGFVFQSSKTDKLMAIHPSGIISNVGMTFNSGTIKGAVIGNYGVCPTASSTAAKTVTIDGFRLATGVSVYIKFSNKITTGSSTTLNINGTGAKNISLPGQAYPGLLSSVYAGDVLNLVYDGTSYRVVWFAQYTS